MTKINLSITVIACLIISSCQYKKETSTLERQVVFHLDSLLADPQIESISLGVIDGKEEYTFHKGILLDKTEPTDKTLYEIASLTKTFTGTLLAQAINENKVSLDDDIRKYLKDNFPNLEFDSHPITFQHLVTHQSGLPNMFPDVKGLFDNPDWNELPFQINTLQENFSRKDFFDELKKVELDTIPGVNFSYSNCGANLIGYLLEEIYNNSYEELLRQKILYNLKMNNTYISKERADLKHIAAGQNTNKMRMPVRIDKEMNAEGGIITSTQDMLKYMRFHLDETNETVKKSHQHLWNGKYGDFDTGFFWQINKNGKNPDIFFQNGGAFGTSSWLTLIPESNMAVFIVTNVAGQNIHQKLNKTVDLIIREIEDNRL